MEQRRLRLGDTLDDYCPRERRVTNHAIVAMIEDEIKQTRCTTCDAEHAYKGARVPRRRKKETPASLFKEVLAGLTDTEPAPVLSAPAIVVHAPDASDATEAGEPADDRNQPVAAEPLSPTEQEEPVADEPDAADAQSEPAGSDDWPMHRPLIRAQLPRIEGQKEERRPTDFTIRQPGGRPNFRGDARSRFRGPGGGNGNGNNSRGHSGQRFAGGGGRPSGPGRGPSGGSGRGPARGGPSSGFRGGPPRQGNGKKRSR